MTWWRYWNVVKHTQDLLFVDCSHLLFSRRRRQIWTDSNFLLLTGYSGKPIADFSTYTTVLYFGQFLSFYVTPIHSSPCWTLGNFFHSTLLLFTHHCVELWASSLILRYSYSLITVLNIGQLLSFYIAPIHSSPCWTLGNFFHSMFLLFTHRRVELWATYFILHWLCSLICANKYLALDNTVVDICNRATFVD